MVNVLLETVIGKCFVKKVFIKISHNLKENTFGIECVSLGQRLCVALRCLVTGDAHATLAASYRMSPNTVSRIMKETCAVIWNVLCDKAKIELS